MRALRRVQLLSVMVFGCASSTPQTGGSCNSEIYWSGRVDTDSKQFDLHACVNQQCLDLAFALTDDCGISTSENGTGWFLRGAACREHSDSSTAEVHINGNLVLGRDALPELTDGDLVTVVVSARGTPILSAEQRLNYNRFTVEGVECKTAELEFK